MTNFGLAQGPFSFSPNHQQITHELPLLGNTSCSAASTCRSLESGVRLLLRAKGLRHRRATLGQGTGKAPERRNLSGVQAARALFSGPETSPKQTGGLLERRVAAWAAASQPGRFDRPVAHLLPILDEHRTVGDGIYLAVVH